MNYWGFFSKRTIMMTGIEIRILQTPLTKRRLSYRKHYNEFGSYLKEKLCDFVVTL